MKAGEVAPGLIVVLSGRVEITQDGGLGRRETIVTHGPGQFIGELAQLSARPSLVDAEALEPVEALVVPLAAAARPDGAGGRARRAHHAGADPAPRRPAARAATAGPIIIGHADNADVLRLQGFLARNGHPHRVLDADSDPCAKTLIERFHVDPHHLPIVLCPNGKLLRNPERERAGALHRPGAADRSGQAL